MVDPTADCAGSGIPLIKYILSGRQERREWDSKDGGGNGPTKSTHELTNLNPPTDRPINPLTQITHPKQNKIKHTQNKTHTHKGEVAEEAEEHLKKRTLLAKALGLVLAAGAGLSIGREG